MVTFKGIKYGAFSGFIATWSISSLIAVIELLLGLKIATFYSVMDISLGLNNVTTAAYAGFGLHLLTGTIIGAALGAIGIRWKKVRMLNPYEFIGLDGSRYSSSVINISTNNCIVSPIIY